MRSLKLRIYPNKKQKAQIEQTIGCCRFVFNWALEQRIKHYQDTQRLLHKYAISNKLVELKKDSGFTWLREVNSQSLQCSIERVDRAFRLFFKKVSKYPKFKSKKNPVQSFDVPQHYEVSFVEKTVKIPKIGVLRFRDKLNFRKFEKVKMITIKKELGKYYACLDCETLALPKTEEPSFGNALGIDLGVKTFATLSNGFKYCLPPLSKQVSKAARQRKDFLHKLSTWLVDNQNWQTIVVEDMQTSKMVSKIKNINRAIFSQGWRMFIEMLRYKCEERGKNFIVISCFEAASRMCVCGNKKSDLKISQREWTCSCGLTHDRDILAAQNIRKIGIDNRDKNAGAQHESISKLRSNNWSMSAILLSKECTH